METASRRRVHALPGARLAVRALAALLTGTLGMETAPAVPQAGRMILASEGGAQAARERLACAGTQHLVLSPEALAGVEQLDAKGQRARTDADLLAATGSACCIELALLSLGELVIICLSVVFFVSGILSTRLLSNDKMSS